MNIPYILVSVLYIAGCSALMATILLQKKRSSGIGSVSGMGNADTYWDKNKGRSTEGTLEKWTKVGGVALLVLTFVLCLL